jgi:tetratricopeptide (TPR) repeat protein
LSDPSGSFADLNEPNSSSDSRLLPDEITVDQAGTHKFRLGAAGTGQAKRPEIKDEKDAVAARHQAMMQQELESVDFYITQGYSDIALDTLDLLERQIGAHPEIDSRRRKLKTGQDTGVSAVMTTPGLNTDASQIGARFAEVSEQPTSPSRRNSGASPVVTGIDSGLAEIFEEFRLEAEGEHVSSNEDYETHYNMATAYKEMDLLDESIREFQTAAGLSDPADGTGRYFQCCTMLGHCFLQKGIARAAVLWFNKGLESPGRSEEEYKALRYELASAYEQLGDLRRALDVFTEVYGVDVGYRDVAEKIRNLQARNADQKKKKKNR